MQRAVRQFYAAATGEVSGTETGYLVNGSWSLNSSVSSSANLTLPNGHFYGSYVQDTAYARNGGGTVTATITEIYSGSQGSLSIVNGVISGAETGYVVNGAWYVNGPVTSAYTYTSPGGRAYTAYTVTSSYALDGNGQPVGTTTQTYSGSGGSFTVDSDGVLSGAESGWFRNGTWYVNGTSTDSNGYTSPNGRVYTSHSSTTTYALDENGVPVPATTETYSGPGGTFTIDASGAISGSEYGYKISSSLYVNTSIPRQSGDLTLFGTTYTFISGSEYNEYNSSGGTNASGWDDYYGSADGGNAHVWSSNNNGMMSQGTSGWDYYVGSFSSDSNGTLTWAARTGPSFKPAQLWANGLLLNWQSGTVDSSGTITDTYSGSTAEGAVTLSFSGQRHDYQVNAATASVLINGSSVGTLSLSGGFNTSGWDIQASDPNRTAPLFSAASLWVNGSEYPFSGGYEDAAGSRTDSYVTTGGTLTISGAVANPTTGTVQVSWNNTAYTGSFNGGGFTVGNEVSISTLPPDSGPPALWAAGRFYTRQPNLNRYVCAVAGAGETATYYLDLSGADATHYTLTGTGAGGTLAGTFDASAGGVFLMTQNSSSFVPGCPANAGGSLRLSAEEPPQEFPPAVMVTNAGVWQFIGTLSEGEATFACYGNATAANSTAASDGAGCLLRIDASGNVTLTNHLASTTSTGTYSTQSHLFQTGTSSSLPMPVCAVCGSSDNHLPWELMTPPNGPDSFVVGNAVWHYAGSDGAGNALYDGYFGGQQLSLGTAGSDGLRLVNVTDPVHGNTQGTLNDVRGSVRLRNGSMAYSGDMSGLRFQPTLNDNNLHTIAADLDITGNVLSFGSLNGDSSTSGVTMQFSDSGTQASLGQTLGRSAAQWTWWRMNPNDPSTRLPVMALDTDNAFGLVLYNPANPAQAAIQLNPAGASSFKGPLRVTPSGDIPMGEFTNGTQP